MDSSDVLFIGQGRGVVSWYRTGQPAFCLGCDWLQIDGYNNVVGGWRRDIDNLYAPLDLSAYKVVVFQQAYTTSHVDMIRQAQASGTRVYYEVDDYLHGVAKIKGHAAADIYTKARLRKHERAMAICDGLIVSTPFLAERYYKFNPNVYVCPNGIDVGRYAGYTVPGRSTLNIGWAGGEGHQESALLWLPAIRQMMEKYEHVRFVSIGLFVAAELKDKRAVALPGCSIENFPGALCNFDIAIGPAGRSHFFRAKSNLRWLETGALGIPLVADPFVYSDIEHMETGLLAETSDEAAVCLDLLISDADLRSRIGRNAQKKIADEWEMFSIAERWVEIFMQSAVA